MTLPFLTTFFDDIFARTLIAETMTLADLYRRIDEAMAPTKEQLGLFTLAEFGSHRTPRPADCLRHDVNVSSISGLVVDYDGEEMPFTEAIARCEAHELYFLAYTSPRHTPAKPRYRVVFPFSQKLPPAEHGRLMNGVNGLFGGTLGAENWSLSQSYYYGHVAGAPFEMHLSEDERCIDEVDLDAIAQPFGAKPKGKSSPGAFDKMDETDLLEIIESGEHYWGPAKVLLTRWARAGVTEADAESNLEAAFDEVPQPSRDKKWAKSKKAIPRWVKDVYTRVAKRRGKFFGQLVDCFENAPRWQGAVRYNSFTQAHEVSEVFPPIVGQTIDRWRPLSDPLDTLEALVCVQSDGGFPKVGKGQVFDALMLAAWRHSYHPVRDWLTRLKWDGQERLSRLFLDYIPCAVPDRQNDPAGYDDMTAYLEQIGACFSISAVARVFEPGVKLDTLPIIVSPQNFNKSKALQALVPNAEWFSDDIPVNISDKDAKQALIGKWIVELSEFPQLRRDVDHVKAFFSRQVDRYRPPYGRIVGDVRRQCAFIASVNELEFADLTGNRRFWPAHLAAPIDVAAIVQDREQLWAEAVHWYNQSAKWWLPPGVEAIARSIQDSHVESDEWDEMILRFLSPKITANNGACPPFTLREVLRHIGFDFTPGSPSCATRADEMRAARRLRRLGYRRDPHRAHGAARQWIPVQT